MSATGLDVFDKTLQTTHIWLDELMADEAIGPDRQLAWHVLGACLRAIRNRLPVELSGHLGSQLPILVRGAYYDQFRPSEMPSRERSLDEFLQPITADLAMARPVNVRDGLRAVLGVLSRHVNQGQIEKVREAMPEDVRNLWAAAEGEDIPPERERRTAGRR